MQHPVSTRVIAWLFGGGGHKEWPCRQLTIAEYR
jgi:hypothetical protein